MHPPSDPDTVPVVSLDDWDDNVWASSSSGSLHRNFIPSLKNTPPNPTRSSHSLHRRRTPENASKASRPEKIQHLHAESSDSIRGHPLKRDSGGFPSPDFNDPTVTRPILNLRLSPGLTVDADKNPFEAEHGVKTGSGEREELVLEHEVNSESDDRYSGRVSDWTFVLGDYNGLTPGSITQVRHFDG